MNLGFAIAKMGASDQPPSGQSAICAFQPTISESSSTRFPYRSIFTAIIFFVMTPGAVAPISAQTAQQASAVANVAQVETAGESPTAALSLPTLTAEAAPGRGEPVTAKPAVIKVVSTPKPEPTPAQLGGILKGQLLLQPPDRARTFQPFNDFRNELEEEYGIGIYAISQTLYARNTLSPAVPYAKIAYPGNDNFYQSSSYLTLTYDMRAFHLNDAQLVIDSGIQKVSWYPGGPESLDFDEATFYKGFRNDNIQFKAGYMSNAEEFIQMRVGGLANNGAAGVLGVLPYNVGMSNKPQQAPSANVRFNLPNHFYTKVGFQRSYSPMGSAGEQAQDKVGFRFAPGPTFDASHGVWTKGDGLLSIFEVDYQKSQYRNPMSTWIRAGYMNNRTEYRNYNTNQYDTRNYLYYLVADKQITQPDEANHRHGLFVGGSAMYTPPAVNKYYQYYEARAYYSGPFKSRPGDFFSLVGARSLYSPDLTKTKAAGTFSTGSWALTPTYNFKLYRTAYWVNALGYTQGPVPGSKYRNTLIGNSMLMVFF